MRAPFFLAVLLGFSTVALAEGEPDWSISATNIEGCSCEMFCPCYFTGTPSHHHGDMFCRFNNAFYINSGHWGDTRLKGVKFWLAGDLGGDFAKGFDWAVITFEPEATPKQREGIKAIVHHIFPGKWQSFTEGKDAKIEWSVDKNKAVAKLDDSKAAEVQLKRNQGMNDDPITIKNLKFWAAPHNDGFKLMQNEVQAYKLGDKAFESKGTSGFVVTIEMTSRDVADAKK